MNVRQDPCLADRFRLISELMSGIVVAVGGAAMAGWIGRIEILKSFCHGCVPMKANTAAGLILAGAALWLLQEKRSKSAPARLAARTAGTAVFLIGLLTVLEYLFGIDIGIDQLLFREAAGVIGTSRPGRMSPNSCINFILAGVALLLIDVRSARGRRPAQYLMLGVGVISLTALIGHLYGAHGLYGIPSATEIALPSTAAFLLLSIGALFARPEAGVMTIFTADDVGGAAARRFIVLSLAVPIAAEILTAAGRYAGLYDEVYEASLDTILIVIAFVVFVSITSAVLSRVEERQRVTARQLDRSQDEYRRLVEDANSIILRMDSAGNITFFNEFAQKFFGYASNEIVGKSVIGTIVPPADRAGHDLKAMIADIAARSRKYLNNENENMLRDGRRVWISWTNRPIFDTGGRLAELLCIGNDITPLKQAETELVKAKELAEAASGAATVVCGPDWKVKNMNIAARRYFNREGAFAAGEDFLKMMFACYQVSVPRAQIADPDRSRISFDLMRPEKAKTKPLYLQASREILRDQLREVTGIVVVVQDVTDTRLEEMMKQSFLGLVSHKLRTPVSVITGDVAVLQDERIVGPMNDKQKAYVATIAKKSHMLADLIDELLKFVETNRAHFDPDREAINLHNYLPALVGSIVEGVTGKKTELTIDCPDTDARVRMPVQYMNLVIKNLIENAIKFNDKEVLKVSIAVKKEAHRIELSVSDNGCGIPPEEYEKIFEGFYQLEKYFTGNVAGAGVGLPLVKRIVTAFGGRISVRSEIAAGATFLLSFPR
ncbi:MAG TPA: PAS domain-containing sensor histidine kinase [bacterium]|nr:PAS domain-containing sensor histidine kinase [bacterium]